MFSEKGAEATTIEDITERADVGKGTFYRHFESKEALLTALSAEAVAHLAEHMRAGGPRASLEEALEGLLNAHVAFLTDSPEKFALVFQGRLPLGRERAAAAEKPEAPYARYLAEVAAQLSPFFPQGIEPAKLRRLASAVAGFASGFFSAMMVGFAAGEIEKSVEPLRRAWVARSAEFLKR